MVCNDETFRICEYGMVQIPDSGKAFGHTVRCHTLTTSFFAAVQGHQHLQETVFVSFSLPQIPNVLAPGRDF